MTDWNADLYLKFAAERTRPAAELLARVPLETVERALDLGCGPGNSTELIVRRFPGASVEGIDTSPAMLGKARARLPQVRFTQSDVAGFRAEPPASLIFANAVLQWVPDHEALFPQLMEGLVPGGVLAVQMPDNLDEPSHRLMREEAAQPDFAERIGDVRGTRAEILSVQDYYDILAPHGAAIDIWRTTYVHVMDDASAIVDWLSASGLKPFLDPLDVDERAAFLEAYTDRVTEAYPRRIDGKVVLPFPRLFIVATKGAAGGSS
ncbi:trans-aconitate 2-methyltransferase [Jiella marina]|uniref:trans-aconitate 2-methyltransferase n=1 Tax=Jiella sp. LLJ827 TaxID=2917712 RepID=UPI00210096FE|nr:trans-aconitate 2-methyltransferase [Jiella sp. LLJ827]MCQ0987103.1 trans-aconitate 2-methyltransferase [Jiella sp. LLJ827]